MEVRHEHKLTRYKGQVGNSPRTTLQNPLSGTTKFAFLFTQAYPSKDMECIKLPTVVKIDTRNMVFSLPAQLLHDGDPMNTSFSHTQCQSSVCVWEGRPGGTED